MRKLVWFTVGFAAACAFGAYVGTHWMLSLGLAAGALAVIGIYLVRFWRPSRLLAAVFLGIACAGVMFHIYDRAILSAAAQLDGKTERCTVYVHDYSYEYRYGSAVDGSIELNGRMYDVRVYLNGREELKPGDRLQGEFQFRYTSTGGLEEVLYHRSEAIFLLAYQKGNCVVERCWSAPLQDLPKLWRQELLDTLERLLPDDAAPFAAALLFGDRIKIDYATDTAFRVSGISHIIAVSGLHVSILFSCIYLLSGKRRFLTALLGIPVIFLFAAVVGFTPSVTRAAVMQCLMMLAMLLRREYDGPTELAFSALVMLIHNPLVIASVSFQLSFACMVGILVFSEPIANWLKDEKHLGKPKNLLHRWFQSSVSISLSASVLTVPLVAVYFGTVSLVGALTNLLTLWVISFIFYGLMAVCIVSFWSLSLAKVLSAIIAWPIRYVLMVSRILAAFPLAAVYTRSVYTVFWLVFVYGILTVFLCLKKKPVALFSAIALGALCLSLGLSWLEPLLGNGRMTVLDVGQGQAILLQSGGKTFLVDCGGDDDENAADVAAETLLSQGICRLDGIIVTHYDRDHAGGLEYLLTRIRTDAILVPFSYDENGVAERLREVAGDAVQTVYEDQTICFDGAELSLFVPESYNSGNESSMCVLFRAENCDILITGDRGEVGERMLLDGHLLGPVDVLMVGHHGSKHSTSREMLEKLRPTYAFISVGEDNSYGHPAEDVLKRLMEFGCEIFRTDEDGTITFRW